MIVGTFDKLKVGDIIDVVDSGDPYDLGDRQNRCQEQPCMVTREVTTD